MPKPSSYIKGFNILLFSELYMKNKNKLRQRLVKRMAALYPQAKIVYASILPRLDYDHVRVTTFNRKFRFYMDSLGPRFETFDYADDFLKVVFPGPRKVPISEYYRDLNEDTVHLSDSGTQVQQDAFNRYLSRLKIMINENKVDLKTLMWQSEWDRFNFWNLKTPSIRPNRYLVEKRITNFTSKQYMEVLENENKQKTRDIIGPQTKFEAGLKPSFRHLGE